MEDPLRDNTFRIDLGTEMPATESSNPMLPAVVKRTVIRYRGTDVQECEDSVASEYALTIFVNHQEMATIVCTPQHLEDLVLGFLASEGVIRSAEQLIDLSVSHTRGTARVSTTSKVNFNQAFYNKRYITSCCGKSRQSFYFINDAHTSKRAEDTGLRLKPGTILQLMSEMQTTSKLFHATGGVHTANLCDSRGVLLSRCDIGRHNALDKLFGHCLRQRVETDDKIVTFSGRLSSEVLLKVSKLGVGIVIAKSAPTAMALDMAQDLNITAVGFARGDGFNVYTHPWRIEHLV